MSFVCHDPPPWTISPSWSDPIGDAVTRSAREFVRAFGLALRTTGAGRMHALELSTVAVARHLREAGIAPERGVVVLKALVMEACSGWHPSLVAPPHSVPSPQSVLYAWAFPVWVAGYYRH